MQRTKGGERSNRNKKEEHGNKPVTALFMTKLSRNLGNKTLREIERERGKERVRERDREGEREREVSNFSLTLKEK